MYLLALNGSPKPEGNTAALLQVVLDEAAQLGAETELVQVNEIMLQQEKPYCQACSSPCTAACFRGTELERIYAKMSRADAIILGSPVYFGTVSAQLKAFWDKTRCLRTDKQLINKVGAAVSSGGARFGGQETTLRALHDMLLVQGMTVVGDGYAADDAGHHGSCAQQPASEDEFARKRAAILARRLVEMVK